MPCDGKSENVDGADDDSAALAISNGSTIGTEAKAQAWTFEIELCNGLARCEIEDHQAIIAEGGCDGSTIWTYSQGFCAPGLKTRKLNWDFPKIFTG